MKKLPKYKLESAKEIAKIFETALKHFGDFRETPSKWFMDSTYKLEDEPWVLNEGTPEQVDVNLSLSWVSVRTPEGSRLNSTASLTEKENKTMLECLNNLNKSLGNLSDAAKIVFTPSKKYLEITSKRGVREVYGKPR